MRTSRGTESEGGGVMGWLLWIGLAVYLFGYVLAFRRIAGQLAWHLHANPAYSWQRGKPAPVAGQWGTAISVAIGVAFVWPVSLPIAHALTSARVGSGLFYVPPKQREQLLEQRIRDLEREVGVG